MGDPLALDAAVGALLGADSALATLCPGGVYYGIAPPAVEAFVVFQRLVSFDDPAMFGAAAREEYHYLVKAVIPGTDTAAAGEAARRIDALLDGNDTIAPDGYGLQAPIAREEAIRYPEIDEGNPDRRVQHLGGQYVIVVQAIAAARFIHDERTPDHAVPRQKRIGQDRDSGSREPQQVDLERRDGQSGRDRVR